jgi:hypothetical protein
MSLLLGSSRLPLTWRARCDMAIVRSHAIWFLSPSVSLNCLPWSMISSNRGRCSLAVNDLVHVGAGEFDFGRFVCLRIYLRRSGTRQCSIDKFHRQNVGRRYHSFYNIQSKPSGTDEDVSEGNPVAIALHREVVSQCPKAYLDYEQRKRTSNPFPAGSLVKQTPTQLLSSPSDYPIRCRGVHGMASTDGKI